MRLKIRCDGESEKFCKIFYELGLQIQKHGGVGGGHMDGRVGPSGYRRVKNFRQTEIFTI